MFASFTDRNVSKSIIDMLNKYGQLMLLSKINLNRNLKIRDFHLTTLKSVQFSVLFNFILLNIL